VIATVVVGLLAVPAGILLTRPFSRPVRPVILGFANLGQAVPSIGVIALLTIIWTIGLRTAIVALVAYAFLPILRNTMVGLQQVNPSIIEAGRGMGMTRRGVLARIELPLAVPVILAGVRTALVITVGTAALATFINAGGLGDIINYGLVQNRFSVTLTGGALTAALAVLIDWVAGIAEDLLRPRGL
jgi:osmoprotectant transport system permease protein